MDEAAKVKADFLYAIAKGTETSACITPEKAVRILGTMLGGYNVSALIDLLDDPKLGSTAADALSKTILIFDSFDKVAALAEKGSENAKKVIKSWSDGKWFLDRPKLKDTVTLTVFKVTGEINTDDLSPAPDAWSRPDIPLRRRAIRSASSAMSSEPAPPESPRPTPSSGSSAMTSLTFPARGLAALSSAARSLLFSSTPWRTPARSLSRWT